MSRKAERSRTSQILAMACLAVLGAAPALASRVSLLSTTEPPGISGTAGGVSSTGYSGELGRRVSADGRYVVFGSEATNLVPGQIDSNHGVDVFLRDRVAGTTVLVSHVPGAGATTGNAFSSSPSLSPDGRWVVFDSRATNLVPGQTGPTGPANLRALFLFDRTTGAVSLVSHAPGSASAALDGARAVIGNGGFVAFTSFSPLVPGQTGPTAGGQVYLHDPATGANTLVSHAAGAPMAGGDGSGSDLAVLSSDGRWIAYESGSGNLVAGVTLPGLNVYLHDRTTGANTLVSHAAGAPATAAELGGRRPRISADGRWIAFASLSEDLVAGQTGDDLLHHAFLYDRDSGGITLISHAAGSPTTAADHESYPVAVSDDGGWVLFRSLAADLVMGQTDVEHDYDLFLFARATGMVTLVSHAAASPVTTGEYEPWELASLSGDGRFVVYTSHAGDLVAGFDDRNGEPAVDAFLFDRTTGANTLVSHRPGLPASTGNAPSYLAEISQDGTAIVFTSEASDLAAGPLDVNQLSDVLLYDVAAGTSAVVSVRDPGLPSAAAGGGAPAVSADGRWVVFSSNGQVLPGQVDRNHGADLFLLDRATGTPVLVSRAAGATPLTTADGPSGAAGVSADGRWVVFTSEATDLVAGQTDVNPMSDVFLFDRDTAITVLVSHAAGSATATGNDHAWNPVISADGAWIAYESRATDLVPGQTDANLAFNGYDVFLYDRAAGTTTLVSHGAGSSTAAGNRPSTAPRLSADGGRLVFQSRATNLVPGQSDGNDWEDVFLYDRAAGTTTLVSHLPGSPTTTGGSADQPDLSADGSWIVFRRGGEVRLFETAVGTVTTVASALSTAAPRISADGRWIAFAAGTSDVFLHDRIAQATRLVSHLPGQPTAAAGDSSGTFTRALRLSADGRFVLFTSQAAGLVHGQADGADTTDLFLYDRDTGESALVSRSLLSPLQAGASPRFQGVSGTLSADGGTVVFTSTASDLAADDRNSLPDAFLYDNGRIGSFFTLPPCRFLDTRLPQDGPALASGQAARLHLYNACGIPETAKAVAVNVTATGATGQGHLAFYRGDAPAAPGTSALAFRPGLTRASFAILPLAANADGSLKVLPAIAGGGTVHVLIDVAGYFE